MTVATPKQPDVTTQSAAVYKAAIDAQTAALAQTANMYAPHEASTPNMTVKVDAGRFLASAVTLVTNAQQTTATITAPVTNPRIDRVVIDAVTGVISVVAGAEAASPSAPAIPSGKLPICQVALATSTAAITNSLITDERAFMANFPALLVSANTWTSDQTLAASLLSTKACASGYVRVGPNLCMKITSLNMTPLTRDVDTTVTNPSADSKAVLIAYIIQAKSNNLIGQRNSTLFAKSNGMTQVNIVAAAYEFAAVAAGTELARSTGLLTLVKNTDYVLTFNDDAGDQGAVNYEVRGYYD